VRIHQVPAVDGRGKERGVMPTDAGNSAIERPGVRDPFLPPGQAHHRFGNAGPTPESALSPQPRSGDGPRGNAAARIDRGGSAPPARAGSLVAVGKGVMAVGQVTAEGQRAIAHADKVLYFGTDPVAEHWLRKLNANAETWNDSRIPNKSARQTTRELVARTLEFVRAGFSVCAVYDGGASVSGFAPHELIARCRADGHRAVLTPGISLADCLFADLGLDPSQAGCQMYHSTDFLVRRRQPDTTAGLILWRVGSDEGRDGCHPALVEALTAAYGADHQAVLYEPAPYAVCEPTIRRTAIGRLTEARVTAMSSLYIPPKAEAAPDPEI
jgi:Tetrapyrrole (Corrin/Porphyrin) Methylases